MGWYTGFAGTRNCPPLEGGRLRLKFCEAGRSRSGRGYNSIVTPHRIVRLRLRFGVTLRLPLKEGVGSEELAETTKKNERENELLSNRNIN